MRSDTNVPSDDFGTSRRDLLRVFADKVPNGVMYEFKKLYFECAHATYPVSLAALLKFAPTSNILFGILRSAMTVTCSAAATGSGQRGL